MDENTLKWNNCCAFTHYNTQVFTFYALIYCSTTNLHNPEGGFMNFTLVWKRCQTELELIKQGLTFIGGISPDRPPLSLVQEEARIEDGWMEVDKKPPNQTTYGHVSKITFTDCIVREMFHEHRLGRKKGRKLQWVKVFLEAIVSLWTDLLHFWGSKISSHGCSATVRKYWKEMDVAWEPSESQFPQ